MVKTEDGIHVPTDRLLDAIDEQTLLVPVSHVIFRSAYINDARAIIEKAHKVGAHVVLDTYQSLGTVPVDVNALNVDFACGGVLKWLCGGPGVAYLYVRPDLGKKLEPKFTGWFAHQDSMAFQTGPIQYTDPPFRFMNGTTHIPALEACRPGLKIIREAAVVSIREKSKRQTARLIQLGASTLLAIPTSAVEPFPSTCPTPSKSAANYSPARSWSTGVPRRAFGFPRTSITLTKKSTSLLPQSKRSSKNGVSRSRHQL